MTAMNHTAEDCQDSSAQTTRPSAVVGVCDECCIDGSADSDMSGCTIATGNDARAVVGDLADPDAADIPMDLSGVDNMKTDPAHDDVNSVHCHVACNDHADGLSVEKATVEGEEECNDTAVNEMLISATDIYSGLHLADSWHPVRALRRREIGRPRACPAQFTWHAGGSVALVRRLELFNKLDGHSGCVNALHFNDSGTVINFSLCMHSFVLLSKIITVK